MYRRLKAGVRLPFCSCVGVFPSLLQFSIEPAPNRAGQQCLEASIEFRLSTSGCLLGLGKVGPQIKERMEKASRMIEDTGPL